MNPARPAGSHRIQVVQRPTGVQKCPYCGFKMYDVEVKEHPEFEVYLCYACGGCVIYEAAAAHR